MAHTLSVLTRHPVKTRVNLTGTLIVARDSAHAKLKERLDRGEGLPDYFKQFPVYTRPRQDPARHAVGSFGPTTAGRMDSLRRSVPGQWRFHGDAGQGQSQQAGRRRLQEAQGLLSRLDRRPGRHPRQELHQEGRGAGISELGMEAIWRIQVENFPAFIVTDDKGNDFFSDLKI